MSLSNSDGIVESVSRFLVGLFSLLAMTVGTGPVADGPETGDGAYQLPAGDEIVIRVSDNNGPVSPDSQTGYVVEIDASGHAVSTVTPPGGSDDLTYPTASETVRVAEIGEEGVQDLLAQLDALGIFGLVDDDAETPDGGGVDLIRITLEDGEWQVIAAEFDDSEQAQLDLAQALAVATVIAESSPAQP